MATALPDDVPDEVRALGQPVVSFKSGALLFVLYLCLGILALLLAAAAMVLFFASLEKGQPRGKGIVIVLAMGGAGIAAISKAVRMRGLQVFVCENGLARVQRNIVETMRWDDINKVVRRTNPNPKELAIRNPFQVVLQARDGREWIFDEGVSGMSELRERIEEQTLKVMLPPAVEALQNGAVIGFGKVSISSEGMQCGRELLPWDRFDRGEIVKGRLLLYGSYSRRPFAKVNAAEVPNVHVLLALAEQWRRQST